jgi:hypothetical protein
MIKATFQSILLYIFLKYLLFYILLMVKSDDFKLIKVADLKSGQDWFYYLWIILFMPIIAMIVFSGPLYFAFKMKKLIYFILLIGIVLIAEYFLYTYFSSQNNLMNGIYLEIIGIFVFIFLFYRDIKQIFSQVMK